MRYRVTIEEGHTRVVVESPTRGETEQEWRQTTRLESDDSTVVDNALRALDDKLGGTTLASEKVMAGISYYFLYKNDKLVGAIGCNGMTAAKLTARGYTLVKTSAPKL